MLPFVRMHKHKESNQHCARSAPNDGHRNSDAKWDAWDEP